MKNAEAYTHFIHIRMTYWYAVTIFSRQICYLAKIYYIFNVHRLYK